VRFLPAMGERIFATSASELYVLLYAASRTEVEVAGTRVAVRVDTDYPNDGSVSLAIDPAAPARFTVRLRIPDWCSEPRLLAPAGLTARRSSPGSDEFVIERDWEAGDVVEVEFPMPPRRVRAHHAVEANVGRVALARGPLVYCLEAADNGGSARNLWLAADAELGEEWRGELLGGTSVVLAQGGAAALDGNKQRTSRPADLVAIPYCLWNNRPGAGPQGEMVVWIPESADLAELPGQGLRVEQAGASLSASHCWNGDTLLALNDGKLPASSGDPSIPRMTFWDHRGTAEWLAMDFGAPRKLAQIGVYWFDDTGRGSCRVPESWSLSWKDGDAWKPVKLASGSSYGVGKDALMVVAFAPVETTALRIDVKLRKDSSAGVLEWQVK
jgi:hypothetical protein